MTTSMVPTSGRKIRVARNPGRRQWLLAVGPDGPAAPFTEAYEFQCNEQTDAELAGLPPRQLADRLLAARGTVGEGLEETERGYWGDMTLMSPQQIHPGPASGWTKIGSPGWLEKVFPDQEHDD